MGIIVVTANESSSGGGVLLVALIGYVVQRYGGLPPPPPRIVGVDLGTTFSSIGVYRTVTGETDIIPDSLGKRSIPSVVAFLRNGSVLVGTRAVEQQEINPRNTIYDSKRFVGRRFSEDEFQREQRPYPFVIKLDGSGRAYFEVELENGTKWGKVTPEEVGSIIISYMREVAEASCGSKLRELVISVPAEFDLYQRSATEQAVKLAQMEVRRVISEPTAAALSYGLHMKTGVEYIVVVDVGGGTLDVSVLWLNNGVFITQGMAGNNRLGGQDFNSRVQMMLVDRIERTFNRTFDSTDHSKEDLQQLRLTIEEAKIQLTSLPETWLRLHFRSFGLFEYLLTREEFERLNADLFASVVEPIKAALEDSEIDANDVDEIVLVGGSTRIPKIRAIVGTFFGKAPNFGVDPELAVVTGAAVQGGVVAGGWPLQVAAMELPPTRRKRHIYTTTPGQSGPLISDL